jgi:predicted AAA+ superfamily ATPase
MVGDMIIQVDNNLTSLIGPAGCGKTHHAKEMISQFAVDGKRITVVNAFDEYNQFASDSITIAETLDVAKLVELKSDVYIFDVIDEFREIVEATAHWLVAMDKRVIVLTQNTSTAILLREDIAKNLIGTAETAKLLKVSKQRVIDMVAEGSITTIKTSEHANWYWRQEIIELANQRQLRRRKPGRKPKSSVQDLPPQTGDGYNDSEREGDFHVQRTELATETETAIATTGDPTT